MGLDIFAASHLKYVGPIPRGSALNKMESAIEEKGKDLTDYYFFLSGNLPAHRTRLGGMKVGLYEFTKKSRKYGFRAGSYSGYGRWRELLCEFAFDQDIEDVWFDAQLYRGRPFIEIINFTDCDGRIGTSVAAKLAADFTSHAKRAKTFADTIKKNDSWSGEGWLEVYRDFARALRLAAKDGALKFC